MSVQWDTTQQRLAEETSTQLSVELGKTKEVVELYLKSCMRHARKYEPIQMVCMGVFYMDARKTNERVRVVFRSWREKRMKDEVFQEVLAKCLELHRIATEHLPLTGRRYYFYKYLYEKSKLKCSEKQGNQLKRSPIRKGR